MKKRCAYTLVEMLIVMLLLAIFVGLAWPTLRSPWGESKLEDAAEQVRAAMADARREAITSVGPWQFCYRPGASDYMVGPLHLDDEATSMTDPLDLDEEETKPELTARQLPHGVTFCDPEADLESAGLGLEESGLTKNGVASEPVDTALSSEDLTFELTSGEWSAPIVFFPNGRSTSDLLRLCGPGPEVRMVTIRVRGILGAADVSKSRRIRQAEQRAEQQAEQTLEPNAAEEVSP